MKKEFAKIMSLLLCIALLCTLLPANVYAAGDTAPDSVNPDTEIGALDVPETSDDTPSVVVAGGANSVTYFRGETANLTFTLHPGTNGSEKYVVEIYVYESDYYEKDKLITSVSDYFTSPAGSVNMTMTWETGQYMPGTYLIKAYTQYYSNGSWYNTQASTCYLYLKSPNPFTDIPENASYLNAVLWAYRNGVVGGTSKTTFSPDDPCRRYQVVQMLYKLNNKPAVSASNPFKDVKTSDSFCNAVLWAVKKGIVSGTSATTFSPQNSCERYQVVQMLYKMAGKPAIGNVSNPFKDVKSTDSYYKAVMWAVNNGITKGTSKTTFSPHGVCSRYQIVVFLYKYNNIFHLK